MSAPSPNQPKPPAKTPQRERRATNPDPKAHPVQPVHRTIPTQPIHEGTDPKQPVKESGP